MVGTMGEVITTTTYWRNGEVTPKTFVLNGGVYNSQVWSINKVAINNNQYQNISIAILDWYLICVMHCYQLLIENKKLIMIDPSNDIDYWTVIFIFLLQVKLIRS